MIQFVEKVDLVRLEINMQTLYKKSKKGDRIQTWSIEVSGSSFRTHEGLLNGTIETSEWTQCFGKNIGKANETSPETQADNEAKSRFQKKLDKGYSPDINDCERNFEVTLAHNLKDHKDKVVFPVYISPKLDGIRCFYKNGKLWTRNGKEIVCCPHIIEEIQSLKLSDLELDGELYNHELKNDFNKIVSLVRKTKPTPEDIKESAELVQYHVFDWVDSRPFGERFEELRDFVEQLEAIQNSGTPPTYQKMVHFVSQIEAKKWVDVDALDMDFVSKGYEGSMLRWGTEGYAQGRTKYLLKIKSFLDEEFEVVDLLDGRGKRENTLGKWVVRLKDETLCEVGPTGKEEKNLEFWLDKSNLIGKMITVKFQGYTPDGKLRFPVFKSIRDYE